MKKLKLIICDGGGTIWYSMDVLYEHAQTAFSYFGLLRPSEFRKNMPFRYITEISSLRTFNSRKDFPKALLALYFTGTQPQVVLNQQDPESLLHDLVLKAWEKCTRHAWEELVKQLGTFLDDALYNYNDNLYPLCKKVREGLPVIRKMTDHLVMLSNRVKASAEAILRAKKVLQYFDEINAPLKVGEKQTKPVGEVILKYMDYYKLDTKNPEDVKKMRDETVFIGDSNLDISSAHQDGKILTIAVLQGMGSRRTLKLDYPYAIVDTLADAPKILQRICKNSQKPYKTHMATLESHKKL